jgi:hypothetical protein
MSYTQRMARAQAKSDILLKFLGSGEVYTTADIVADLLQIDRRRAAALLVSLEKQGFLNSELHGVNARQLRIAGITPHGLAYIDMAGGQHFELGRTNSSWISHRLECQRIRIAAEAAGWTGWTTERQLRDMQLKKIPDAVATDPAGSLVAIELERFAKTPKRYSEVIAAHLLQVKAGHYSRIEYVSPPGIGRLIRNSIGKIEAVKVNGESVRLEQKHFDRFTFHSIDNWPEVRNG